MAKKRTIKNEEPKQVILPKITNEMENLVRNGLTEAILGFNPGNMGTPLNSLNTLWINNRWYLASNMRQLLSESYVEHGILQTICQVPVDDAFRGGIEIHTKQLDPSQIEELQMWMEEENDMGVLAQACVWNRLFGGAGVVIITDQDPETPLELEKVTKLELRAADMWELFWNKQNTEDYSVSIDTTANMDDIEYFQYYGFKLDASRVLKQRGIEAPSLIRPRLRGWGTSVCEVLINSINQYLKSNNLIFEVLDEFKVDYYKIKNLANTLLSPGGDAIVRKRIALANKQKNYQNAVAMDSEDDFIQRQLTFTGLSETMVGIRMQIASDMRMPLSKVFGISSQGFGSGEDDIENYNGMIESSIRQKTKYEILKIVKIRCQLMFKMVPDDLKIMFKPLRMLSAEQEETVKTQKFARVAQARQMGEITSEEFRECANKDQLLPIQLEITPSILSELEQDQDAGEPESGDDIPDDKVKPKKAKKPVTQPKEAKT